MIATNRELMRFSQAFFGGELFGASHIDPPIFRPIQFHAMKYGNGMMQLTVASLLTSFFGGACEIRGHCGLTGLTGSFAFYCPQKDVFITGTVNQLKYRPYAATFRAIAACDKKAE